MSYERVDTRSHLGYVPVVSRLPQHGREVAGKHFPYVPRARLIGNNLQWLCPRCGKFNCHVMTPLKWRVTCKRSSCHLTLVVGIRFGVLQDYGGCRPPLRPADQVFPECELFPWRSGEPASLLVDERQSLPSVHSWQEPRGEVTPTGGPLGRNRA